MQRCLGRWRINNNLLEKSPMCPTAFEPAPFASQADMLTLHHGHSGRGGSRTRKAHRSPAFQAGPVPKSGSPSVNIFFSALRSRIDNDPLRFPTAKRRLCRSTRFRLGLSFLGPRTLSPPFLLDRSLRRPLSEVMGVVNRLRRTTPTRI